jgi:phage baseplate assembly protein W
MKYYAIPFNPEHPAGNFRKSNTEESVRQHIRLLLSAMPGSFRFSPLFGSSLNKHHYHLPDKRRGEKRLENELKEKLQTNLRQLIGKYEPRLVLHEVEVTVKLPGQEETGAHQKGGRIVFDINLIGMLNGKESFEHAESIYLK